MRTLCPTGQPSRNKQTSELRDGPVSNQKRREGGSQRGGGLCVIGVVGPQQSNKTGGSGAGKTNKEETGRGGKRASGGQQKGKERTPGRVAGTGGG